MKCEVIVVVAVLLLSVIISCLQASYVSAQASLDSASGSNNPSIQLNYGSLSVTAHKMSATELQQYKNGVGVYQEGHNYNQIVDGHGTGLSPPTSDEWADIAKGAYVVDRITYQSTPAAVDQSKTAWFPPIGDQGRQGSCAFFADVYYAKTYQEAKEHQWNLSQATWVYDGNTEGYDNGHVSVDYQSEVMSPAFVYNLMNNGTDSGGSMEGPIMIMCSIGVSSWQNMPYDQNNCTWWPSEAAWAEAPYYRSNSTYSYQYIFANQTDGITNLKNWLAAGNVATFAIDAYDNIDPIPVNNSRDFFTLDNWIFGGLDHAQTIVGYNDSITYMENGVLHSGAFKIVNSWGIDGWENIPDGCYWMSYQVMAELSATGDPVVLSQDLVGYQPQILATFNISHAARSDCNITFGLGTPSAPIITKTFDNIIQGQDLFEGGALPFCANNIVFDLTEFKAYMSSLYNQPFFMQVCDLGSDKGGTSGTGTINSFAIGNTSSTQAPTQTVNDQYVNLTLTTSLAPPTFNVSPTSGPPSGAITLNGIGFAGSSVNISYLNSVTSAWIPIVNNLAISSENFSYVTHAPDLLQNSPSGDNAPLFGSIVFRAQDNSNGISYNTTTPYTEWRRGLTQVGTSTATGVYGNNTDFASTLFVENEQSITVSGKWFSPGTATFLWDDTTSLGTTPIDATGLFNVNVQVPTTTAGPHNLTINDGSCTYCVNLTRLPKVTDDYTDSWRTADFKVNLTPDYSGTETYYKINDGPACSVSTDGQPLITTEGPSNTLEYWSTWNVYGTGSMELSHMTLTGIKLDKTTPQASLQINGGLTSTTSSTVTLTLTATDSTSGVNQIRFSNYDTWNQATWEPYASSKSWQLTSGDGAKTVYCEIQDNGGLNTTVSASITLNTSQPSPTPSPPSVSPTPTPTATTVPATTDTGATVDLAISGNVTSTQMSNVTIATNQSATSTTVSFTLTGESGTTGFSNMTIPKSAVHYGTTPTIYIDGQPAQDQGYTQDANNYYVWYTTHFSTHEISIVFTTTSPSPTPTAQSSLPQEAIYEIAVAVAVVAIVAVVLVLRKSKKSKS